LTLAYVAKRPDLEAQLVVLLIATAIMWRFFPAFLDGTRDNYHTILSPIWAPHFIERFGIDALLVAIPLIAWAALTARKERRAT
jgi:hypothetical protein